MSTSSEIILAVCCAIGGALLGAFASYLLTQSIEKKKAATEAANAAAEAQRRLAGANADRIRDVRVACERLRDVADTWYKEIRTAIDPSQSPSRIVSKLHDLFQQKTYEGRVYDLGLIIKDEPTCAPVLEAYPIWRGDAFLIKKGVEDGVVYRNVARNPELNRFYSPPGPNEDPALRDKYLKNVQDQLFQCYSSFDAKLDRAIEQLHEMESEARQKSLAGLETPA